MIFELNVIGVDEAGRGPLAGPVVVAAVRLRTPLEGLGDSKVLTPSERAVLRPKIEAEADWAVVFVDAEEIDRRNILQATFSGMVDVVTQLGLGLPVKIDGNQCPPQLLGRAEPMVKGDARHASIAAASILAKEHRDEFMRKAAEEYPGYGFEKHFGYGTAEHLEALREWGPCPLHRRTFEPLQTMLLQPCLMLD